MVHVPQQLDLTQRPLCVYPILKRVADLLNGNLLLRLRIDSRAAGRRELLNLSDYSQILLTYFPNTASTSENALLKVPLA